MKTSVFAQTLRVIYKYLYFWALHELQASVFAKSLWANSAKI